MPDTEDRKLHNEKRYMNKLECHVLSTIEVKYRKSKSGKTKILNPSKIIVPHSAISLILNVGRRKLRGNFLVNMSSTLYRATIVIPKRHHKLSSTQCNKVNTSIKQAA